MSSEVYIINETIILQRGNCEVVDSKRSVHMERVEVER